MEGEAKERQVDDLSRAVLKGKVRNRTYLKVKGITKKRRGVTERSNPGRTIRAAIQNALETHIAVTPQMF